MYDGDAKRQVIVPTSNARVLAADGVDSRVRRALETQAPTFSSEIVPWRSEFRALFSPPGRQDEGLDPGVHYIFDGCYAAVVPDGAGGEAWTCVLQPPHHGPPRGVRVCTQNQIAAAFVTLQVMQSITLTGAIVCGHPPVTVGSVKLAWQASRVQAEQAGRLRGSRPKSTRSISYRG